MLVNLEAFEHVAGKPAFLHQEALPPRLAADMLWRVIADVFAVRRTSTGEIDSAALAEPDIFADDLPRFVAEGVRAVQRTFRAPWVSSSYRIIEDVPQTFVTWGPAVGFLAGHLAHLTDVVPDLAVVTLYRDGRDCLQWHCDNPAIYGPELEHVFVATYSFGAERTVTWRPLELLPDDGKRIDFLVPANSVYVMRPDTQHRFAHRVPPADDVVGPRVGVGFFCLQRAPMGKRPWWVSHPDHGPVFVGEAKGALAALAALQPDEGEALAARRKRLLLQGQAGGVTLPTAFSPRGRQFDDCKEMREYLEQVGLMTRAQSVELADELAREGDEP